METISNTDYEAVVTGIRDSGECVSWKDVDCMFGDEFRGDELGRILDSALDNGDLVRAGLGTICGPEHLDSCPCLSRNAEDEYGDDLPCW